jgi:hypothetical protein
MTAPAIASEATTNNMVIFFMVLSFGRLAEAIYSMFGRFTPGIDRLNACKSHEEAHLVVHLNP